MMDHRARKISSAKDWLGNYVRNHPEFISATDEEKLEHELRHGMEYGWTVEYSKERLSYLNGVVDALDDKASSVINYLSTFTGLSVVAVVYAAAQMNPLVALASIPAIIAALSAVGNAIKARTPAAFFMPPVPEWAVSYAEEYPDNAEARFVLQVSAACVAVGLIADAKGEVIATSMKRLMAALWLLLLPCIIAAVVGFHPVSHWLQNCLALGVGR